jgi:hypothetical protein
LFCSEDLTSLSDMYIDKKIQVSFIDEGHGWILMKLELPEKTISVNLSNVFDPFPDLLRWMEDICKDCLPALLIIDEEGYGKKFIADRLPKDAKVSVLLRVYEWRKSNRDKLDKLLVKSEISKYIFVKSVLNRLQSFCEKKRDLPWRSDYSLYELPFDRVRKHLKGITNH